MSNHGETPKKEDGAAYIKIELPSSFKLAALDCRGAIPL
jgi:hypothetical protein